MRRYLFLLAFVPGLAHASDRYLKPTESVENLRQQMNSILESESFKGEYVSSISVALQNMPANATYGNLLSVTLPPGDWDVQGMVRFYKNGASVGSQWISVLSAYSGSTDTDHEGHVWYFDSAQSYNSAASFRRFSLTTTATIYLKTYAEYTGGPPQARGLLSARRVDNRR